MSKNMNVPKLRFKEFDGEWEEKTLGHLIKSLDAGVSVNSTDQVAKDGEKAILKTSCVSYGTFNITENKLVFEKNEISRLKEPVKANTIIISRMNTPALVGANAFVKYDNENVFLPDRLWAAKIKSTASPEWTAILTSSDKIRTLLSARATGTSNSMKNITKADVLTLPIVVPSKQEQEKIASFLTSVDTKIEQLTRKEELLQQYKKGVMQKIFSQEIRFKADDGSLFPAWEKKKLGDVGITYNGLTGKTSENFGSGKPYIQYKQIFDNAQISVDGFGYVSIEPNEKQNKAQFGDIFFTTSSETPNEVAFASVLLDKIEEVYLNSFCFGYRPKSLNTLKPHFAKYLFRSANFRKEAIKLAQGSTRYNISKVELMKTVLQLPCLEEQTKIANFLSSIDSKIEQVQKQLNSTKEFKKALLQQMFV